MTLGQANYYIRQTINNNDNFLIVGHETPDGDSVGSSLMLYHMLIALNKTVEIWFKDTPAPKYSFMPGFNQIQVVGESPPQETFDANFVVDTRNLDLIGFTLPAGEILNIDHRAENTDFGDINYVDPNACSTTEMIYRITYQYNEFGYDLCMGMYLGLFADTAWFTNVLTDEHTFNMASKCVTEGIDPAYVATQLSG